MTIDDAFSVIGNQKTDCDCRQCEARRTVLAELERLKVERDHLPKTADGVPMYPGMEVFINSPRWFVFRIYNSDVRFFIDWMNRKGIGLITHDGKCFSWDNDLFSTAAACDAAMIGGDAQ